MELGSGKKCDLFCVITSSRLDEQATLVPPPTPHAALISEASEAVVEGL